MVHVFLTGASGYIGNAVALALRRAGHHVYGLVRTQEKANLLIQQEITPVIGDASKPETWSAVAAKATVLIHTAVDFANFEAVDSAVTNTFLSLASAPGQQKKSRRVIYTSGCLVYRDNPHAASSEDSPLTAQPYLGARITNENKTLSHEKAVGVSIRPAFVFGGYKIGGSYLQSMFSISEGKVVVRAKGHGYSLIHIDDLAELYRAVVEAPAAVVDGQVYNAADQSRYTNFQVGQRIADLLKAPLSDTNEGVFPPALVSTYVTVDKARLHLNWVARHPLLLDELPTYLGSFLGKAL